MFPELDPHSSFCTEVGVGRGYRASKEVKSSKLMLGWPLESVHFGI